MITSSTFLPNLLQVYVLFTVTKKLNTYTNTYKYKFKSKV